MPSDSMNIQEQGFRSRMFGGFDKNDVLAYMNTLANEAQQHELEYQEKLRQLQSQLDDLRSQRSDAEARVDALKAELAAANQRADLAESKRRESDEQLQKAQAAAENVQSEHREIQKNANIWQLKCHDLQQQNETLTQQLAAARQLNAAPAPTPDVVREAKLEAQKILADAKLYAESAEKELKQQADTQKSRMAENARGIASGVMLVRDRLARVDQRLSAATLDLDNLTLAIYQALDETEAELKELGVEMRDYAQGTPETDIPVEPVEEAVAAPAAPQPVPQAQPVQQTPVAPPKPEKFRVKATPHRAPAKPVRRLRSVNRPVSQLLQDQIDRMGNK